MRVSDFVDWILAQQSRGAHSCPPYLLRTVRGSLSAARSKALVPLWLATGAGIQSAEVSGSREHPGWGKPGSGLPSHLVGVEETWDISRGAGVLRRREIKATNCR